MVPFDRIQESDGRVRVDWHLMQNGAVTLFGNREEFDYAASWLTNHDYVVHAIQAADVTSFASQMSKTLSFPLLYNHK